MSDTGAGADTGLGALVHLSRFALRHSQIFLGPTRAGVIRDARL